MGLLRKSGKSVSEERVALNKENFRKAYALFHYFLPYKKYFILALILLFLNSGLSLFFPYLMGSLFGGIMGDSEISASPVDNLTNRIVIFLILLLALQAFLSYWRVIWFVRSGEFALRDIRSDLFRKLVRMPMGFFSKNRIGEVSSRIAADLSLINDTFINAFPQFIRQSVLFLGGMLLIFFTSWKLSLFMLAFVPLTVLITVFLGKKVKSLTKKAQDHLAQSNVVVEESLQNILSVKAFSNELYEEKRYRVSLSGCVQSALRAAHFRAVIVAFIIFALFGVVTLVVWYGVGLKTKGELSGDDFARFVLYSIFVVSALASLPEVLGQIQRAVGATHRVRELLRESSEPEATGKEEFAERLRGEIEFKNVSFRYPSREKNLVLSGIDFCIEPGEHIAIVGPSGAGKSTLVSLLLNLYHPESGTILFDKREAAAYTIHFLRSQMALVPQEILLFGGTIKENIAYGKIGASEEEIIEAARLANAEEFILDFPEGYETRVGDRGVQLSGGQRQRIAIARAFLADPAILILDEATSSLDSENEYLLQEALVKLMKERTSLIIAHRLSTVRTADRIIVLQEGKIVEMGKHEQLLEKEKGVYAMLSKFQLSE